MFKKSDLLSFKSEVEKLRSQGLIHFEDFQKPVVILASEFNSEIVSTLEKSILKTLEDLGDALGFTLQVEVFYVPGAFELGLAAQWKLEDCLGGIALGVVIKGQTDHYQWVCEAATKGCLEVGLKMNKPLIFGVLTTDNEEQAWERAKAKGPELALALVKMLLLKNKKAVATSK